MINLHKKVLKNIALPIADMFTGSSVYKTYNELKKSEFLSRSQIDNIKIKKLHYLINYSYRYVPFYNKIFRNLNISPGDIRDFEDLKKLPIINKQIIKENFNDFISTKSRYKKLRPRSTGGSTGNPLRYFVSWKTYSYHRSLTYRAWNRGGYEFGNKMITVAGSSLSKNTKIPFKNKLLYNFFDRNIKLSSFDMTEETLSKYVNTIINFRPKHIRGYANSLDELSKYIKKNNLNLPNIDSIFSASEKLTEASRNNIEQTFHCKVFDNYGAPDGSAYANECEKHNGLHIDEEICHIEIDYSKSDGKKYGNMLSTSLVNLEFPFIRYDVGDLAQFSDKPCSCGRNHTLLSKIVGRNQEFVRTSTGKKVHGEFFSHMIRQLDPDIIKFQVIQKKLDKLEFRIIPHPKFDSKILNKFNKILIENLGETMRIEFILEDKIEDYPSGKLRSVISELI